LTLRDLSLKQEYRSDRDDVVSEFFIPCLTNSIQYDRTIEFISVKSLSTLTFGLENIQDHHAKIRLVSGHRFTTSDLNAIVKLFDHHNPSRLNGRLYLDKKISNFIQDSKIRKLKKVIEDLKSKGTNVNFIPGGGSNSIGALGYVECLNEIIKENNKYNFTQIVHATGSSGTQSGLLAGRKYFNCNIPVTGISVMNDKNTQENKVFTEAKNACNKLQCKILDKSEVVVYDDYVGPGYGEPSDGMIEATRLLAKKEAILLDPVYSGKGFAGLIDLVKNKKFTKNDNVLFIHTGGAVSLSAYEWAFNK